MLLEGNQKAGGRHGELEGLLRPHDQHVPALQGHVRCNPLSCNKNTPSVTMQPVLLRQNRPSMTMHGLDLPKPLNLIGCSFSCLVTLLVVLVCLCCEEEEGHVLFCTKLLNCCCFSNFFYVLSLRFSSLFSRFESNLKHPNKPRSFVINSKDHLERKTKIKNKT